MPTYAAMTDHGYRTALEILGWSQVAAAKLFGIADHTSRAYALCEQPVPEPIALALRLLMQRHLVARHGYRSPARCEPIKCQLDQNAMADLKSAA